MNYGTNKMFKLFLIASTFILPGIAISEPYKAQTGYSYHIDFDNAQSQSEVLNNIQKQVKNKTNDEELKIILFGKGKALSLDANALNNTKIEYGNTDAAIQKKMSKLSNKGVRFIICKTPTSRKRHYSTKRADTTIEEELLRLKSQGYNCN